MLVERLLLGCVLEVVAELAVLAEEVVDVAEREVLVVVVVFVVVVVRCGEVLAA